MSCEFCDKIGCGSLNVENNCENFQALYSSTIEACNIMKAAKKLNPIAFVVQAIYLYLLLLIVLAVSKFLFVIYLI